MHLPRSSWSWYDAQWETFYGAAPLLHEKSSRRQHCTVDKIKLFIQKYWNSFWQFSHWIDLFLLSIIGIVSVWINITQELLELVISVFLLAILYSNKVTKHSAIKGHVSNQSLYKGWKQPFPCFNSWSENGHYFLSWLSNYTMPKWNLTFLGFIISKGTCVYIKYNIMKINFISAF